VPLQGAKHGRFLTRSNGNEIKTLEDFFHHELKDFYSAEKQITKALPKIIKAAASADLQEALKSHLDETKHQIARLKEVFGKIGLSAPGAKQWRG
jgi:ferritin-like metal-binding protein YciE